MKNPVILVSVKVDPVELARSLDYQELWDFILALDRTKADIDFTESLILFLVKSLKQDYADGDLESLIKRIKEVSP